MNLRTQRRIAAQLLKAGENRVWIDPEKLAEVAGAITKQDIKKLISQGVIIAKPVVGASNFHAKIRRDQKKRGRQKGMGKRRGKKGARTPTKKAWIKGIRAIRRELATLRAGKKITPSEYGKLYRSAGAGTFRDKANLRLQVSKLKEAAAVVVEEKSAKIMSTASASSSASLKKEAKAKK